MIINISSSLSIFKSRRIEKLLQYFHLYGPHTDSLRIFIKKITNLWQFIWLITFVLIFVINLFMLKSYKTSRMNFCLYLLCIFFFKFKLKRTYEYDAYVEYKPAVLLIYAVLAFRIASDRSQ